MTFRLGIAILAICYGVFTFVMRLTHYKKNPMVYGKKSLRKKFYFAFFDPTNF